MAIYLPFRERDRFFNQGGRVGSFRTPFSWKFRKSITLSRASGAVTNYQMKLLVGESSGATGENVDCGGNCKSDFSDLRFTNSANGQLDYWIESITGTTPNQLATVWIEFDYIGTSATSFYMYYGKADASAVSNGANTFIAFDDFERGSNGDAVGGDWSVNAGCTISTDHAFSGNRSAKIAGHASDWTNSMSILQTQGDIAIQFRFWKENAAHFAVWHGNASNTGASAVNFRATEDIYVSNSSTSDIVDTTKNCQADAWDFAEIRNFNWTSETYNVYYTDGQLAIAGAVMAPSGSPGKVTFYDRASGSGNDTYIDNYLVRQFLATEPAWGSWGTEETT